MIACSTISTVLLIFLIQFPISLFLIIMQNSFHQIFGLQCKFKNNINWKTYYAQIFTCFVFRSSLNLFSNVNFLLFMYMYLAIYVTFSFYIPVNRFFSLLIIFNVLLTGLSTCLDGEKTGLKPPHKCSTTEVVGKTIKPTSCTTVSF